MSEVVLTLRDTDVLEALRADRDDCGKGIERAEIEHLAGTRFIEGVMRRLTLNGFVVGEMGGRYQLSHENPASTEASDDGRSHAAPPAAPDRTSGVSVEAGARLFELPSVPHYRSERAA